MRNRFGTKHKWIFFLFFLFIIVIITVTDVCLLRAQCLNTSTSFFSVQIADRNNILLMNMGEEIIWSFRPYTIEQNYCYYIHFLTENDDDYYLRCLMLVKRHFSSEHFPKLIFHYSIGPVIFGFCPNSQRAAIQLLLPMSQIHMHAINLQFTVRTWDARSVTLNIFSLSLSLSRWPKASFQIRTLSLSGCIGSTNWIGKQKTQSARVREKSFPFLYNSIRAENCLRVWMKSVAN